MWNKGGGELIEVVFDNPEQEWFLEVVLEKDEEENDTQQEVKQQFMAEIIDINDEDKENVYNDKINQEMNA